MNVLINVSERRFHLNNVNFYVKNYGSVNTNGKGFRLRGRELEDIVKQQQDYERGERVSEITVLLCVTHIPYFNS